MNSIARRTLERAQFFLEQAKTSESGNRRAFEHFLEAAIVFGRSVTFHLQKEFNTCTGFKEWYEQKQEQMESDPLFKFFKEKRNYILKEGPVPVQKTITIGVTESFNLSLSVEARVKRAKPWYKRSPKIWWEDTKAAIVWPLQRWRYERRLARKRKQHQQPTRSEIQERLHFEEQEWRNRAATDVLQEYLHKLECLVEEAESRFGGAESSESYYTEKSCA